VFKVGIIRIDFKCVFIKSNLLIFQIFDFNCLNKKKKKKSLNLHIFYHIFPKKNCQVIKIQSQKKHVNWVGGLIRLFNVKISPNYVTSTSLEEMKIKYTFTS
jgi:hypothetical protein